MPLCRLRLQPFLNVCFLAHVLINFHCLHLLSPPPLPPVAAPSYLPTLDPLINIVLTLPSLNLCLIPRVSRHACLLIATLSSIRRVSREDTLAPNFCQTFFLRSAEVLMPVPISRHDSNRTRSKTLSYVTVPFPLVNPSGLTRRPPVLPLL